MWAAETARAVEICEEGARTGQGSIVFVAGGQASGRSALLGELQAALSGSSGFLRVLKGQVVDGRYVASDSHDPIGHDVVEAVERALGVAGSAFPLLGLLGQIASASRTGVQTLIDHSAEPSPSTFARLFGMLRSAAREAPIACLIDDCDEMDGRWWSELLLGFAADLRRLPVFLFLTLEGEQFPDDRGQSNPDALFTARALVEDGLAEWWPLLPMSVPGMAKVTGVADRAVLERLHDLTAGRAGLAEHVWEEWRQRGIVERDTYLDPWRFAAGQPRASSPSVAHLVRERVGERLASLDEVERIARILRCAALEGRVFTADAVALATQMDPDDVMDLLDDRLGVTDRDTAIVEEIGFVAVSAHDGRPRSLCRYYFPSPLTRMAFAPDAGGQDTDSAKNLIRALAQALEEVYGEDRPRIASTLARLYARLGDEASSRDYWRLSGAQMPDHVLLEQARPLLQLEPDELRWHEAQRAAVILLDAGSVLHGAGPLDEVIAVGGQAARLGQRTGIAAYEGEALRLQGTAEIDSGDHEAGRSHLELAARVLGTAGIVSGQANALENLAWLACLEDDLDQALAITDDVLELWRRSGDLNGELGLHLLVTDIGMHSDRSDLARRSYQAASALAAHASTFQSAELTAAAGWLAREDGDYERAAPYFGRAAELFLDAGQARFATLPLLRLSRLLVVSDPDAARPLLDRALAIGRDIQSLYVEASALEVMAFTERACGDLVASERLLRECQPLYEAMRADSYATQAQLHLADVLCARGKWSEARAERADAADRARRLGLVEYESFALTGMAALDSERGLWESAEPPLVRARSLVDPEDDLFMWAETSYYLGMVLLCGGRSADAREIIESALAVHEATEDDSLLSKLREALDAVDTPDAALGWKFEVEIEFDPADR